MASVALEIIDNHTISETQKFTWKIPNFLEIRHQTNIVNKLKSTFDMGSTIGIPCKFEVRLGIEESEGNRKDAKSLSKPYIGIYLKLADDNDIRFILTQFLFEIESKRSFPNKTENYISRQLVGTLVPKSCLGYDAIPQKGDISNMAMTKDGALLIHLKIFNRNATPDLMLSAYTTNFEHKFRQKLCNDLKKMYTASFQTTVQTVEIICKDGRKLLANRDIISARSSVIGDSHDSLKMETVSFDVLNILVQFLYTGTLHESWKQEEIIAELLWCAFNYKLADLMEFLTQVVALACTVSNCGKLVGLARQLGLKDAEKQLLEFFERQATDLDQVNQFVADGNLKLPESGVPLPNGNGKHVLLAKYLESDQILWEKHQFSCEIPNFLKRLQRNDFTDGVLRFDMGRTIGISSRWAFCIESETINGKNWIGIHVRNDVPMPLLNDMNVPIFFALEVAGAKQREYFREEINQNLDNCNLQLGFDKVIPEDDIKSVLSNSGSLKVNFTVIIFNVNSTAKPDPDMLSHSANFENKFGQNLQSDLQKLYTNLEKSISHNEKAELTKIVANDGKKFLVNRTILCARSDVFQTMFQQKDMVEVNNGVVQIDDISSQSLNVLLHFLHSGKLLESWKNPKIVEELAYAAQKYMVNDLREFMDQMLVQACTTQNCGKLLSLAQRLEMKVAEKQLMEYFKKNCIKSFEQVALFAEQANASWTLESQTTGGSRKRKSNKRTLAKRARLVETQLV